MLSGLLDFGMIPGIRAVSCTSPGLVGVSVLILALFAFLQCTLRLWILHGHHERDSAVFAAEVQRLRLQALYMMCLCVTSQRKIQKTQCLRISTRR